MPQTTIRSRRLARIDDCGVARRAVAPMARCVPWPWKSSLSGAWLKPHGPFSTGWPRGPRRTMLPDALRQEMPWTS